MTISQLENYKQELVLLINDGNIDEAEADVKFIEALDKAGVTYDEYLEGVGAG